MRDVALDRVAPAPITGATAPKRRTGAFSGLRREETIAGYLFLLPNLIGFLIFSLIPIAATFGLTLTNWNLVGERAFVGLDNYLKLVNDKLFWQTARNTVSYTLGAVPAGVFIAFWLALLLNRKMRGVVFFRTVFFLPHVTLTVAIAIVWAWIYHPELGLVNYVLGLVGIDGPRWLQSTTWAMPAIIIMSNWKGIGYAMLDLPRRAPGHPPGAAGSGDDRRRQPIPALAPHHRAAPRADDLFHPGDVIHRGDAGLRPVLRDDAGRSGIRHDHAGHVHLPERLRMVPDGLRGHGRGSAIRQHLRHHGAAVATGSGRGSYGHEVER